MPRKLFCSSLALTSLLLLNGCLGTSFLERGEKDGKDVRDTPSLHTVPERPAKISSTEREAMTQDMKTDFQETSKGLE